VERTAGADLALVFFVGHGLASEEGNVLTPFDAKVNCAISAVTQGVRVERIMAATEPARMELVILDAFGGLFASDASTADRTARATAGGAEGLMIETLKRWAVQWVFGTTIAAIGFGILAAVWPDVWWYDHYLLSFAAFEWASAIGALWATVELLCRRSDGYMRRLIHCASNWILLIVALVLLHAAFNDREFTRPPINGVPYYGDEVSPFYGFLSFGIQCVIWIVNLVLWAFPRRGKSA